MSQSLFGRLSQLISKLFSRKSSSSVSDTSSSPAVGSPNSSVNVSSSTVRKLAWAGHQNVTPKFACAVIAMCERLKTNPDWMMGCMAFETGPKMRFRPDARNLAGSTGTGLIQFMASTALPYFYTEAQIKDMNAVARKTAGQVAVDKLASMTQLEQLEYVERYFRPYIGRLNSLEDLYMAILWPAAAGKPADYVLFRRGTLAYTQNAGLDSNGDGVITKSEAAAKVRQTYQMGLEGAFYGEVACG